MQKVSSPWKPTGMGKRLGDWRVFPGANQFGKQVMLMVAPGTNPKDGKSLSMEYVRIGDGMDAIIWYRKGYNVKAGLRELEESLTKA